MSEHFTILQQDKDTSARLGRLLTAHGEVETPCFMPVGTQGTVKAMLPRDLREIGAVRRVFRRDQSSSGAPPERARSSFLILSTFMPRARFVIVSRSSSKGGGSPLMKRSGFTRETTKFFRYGLVRPFSLSLATASRR